MEILEHLLECPADAGKQATVEAWWRVHRSVAERWPNTVDLALAGGLAADRPGWAFASGYQAALRALLPELRSGEPAALCASEQGGAHPQAIRTRLEGTRLLGSKTFVTLGAFARQLVVIATEGQGIDGRSRLRAVVVPADRIGVTTRPGRSLSFVPEVPHAVVELDCEVGSLLPGDGYLRYLKPFRTIEDLHVYAALTGWLLRIGRDRWPPELVEQGLAVAAAARGLAGADPSAWATWRALGGLMELASRWIATLDESWDRVDEGNRRLWERDRAILGVAHRARVVRLERARGG